MTLEDKLATVKSLEELEGFSNQIKKRDPAPPAEFWAKIARMKVEFQKNEN